MHIKRMRIFLLIMAMGMVAVGGIGLAADEVPETPDTFMPVILYTLPPPELIDAWVEDQTGVRSETYAPGESVQFHIRGVNPANPGIDVQYKWSQTNECGGSQSFEDTLTLPAGDWEYQHPGMILDCLGTHTNIVTISYRGNTSTLITYLEVRDTSSQIIHSSGTHGFEKCGLPSIEQMQTWADESPYDVFNIYLGGDHFACKLLIDADWVNETAAQGWDFILTWAGHGTECWEAGKDNYHPISSNPVKARREGRAAAEEAIAAARSLGFLGQKIIYYDVEGYTGNSICRSAMEAFLEGWAERLKESGDKAGAYGSPCRSYIMDWADNDPPLDDIWFARWNVIADYDPDATVDDSDSTYCPLPDYVWPSRRIRQYAGDHPETWGPCDEDDNTCTINSITSNVLDGEITRFILGK